MIWAKDIWSRTEAVIGFSFIGGHKHEPVQILRPLRVPTERGHPQDFSAGPHLGFNSERQPAILVVGAKFVWNGVE